ncbi:hypothetical protein [Sphingomonas sp. UYP23]
MSGWQDAPAEPAAPAWASAPAEGPPAKPTHDQFNRQLEQMVKAGHNAADINQFASDNGLTINQGDLARAVKRKDARAVSREDVPPPAPYKPHSLWQTLVSPSAAAADSQAVDNYTRTRGNLVDKSVLALRESFANTATGIGEGIAGLPDLAIKGVGMAGGGLARLFGAPGIAQSLENPVTIGGMVRSATGAEADPKGEAGMARAISRGVGGATQGIGIGNLLQNAKGSVARGIGAVLSANPGTQITAGATGALGGEAARQAGGGPIAQTIASLAAGGLGGLAGEGTAALGTGARNVLTDRGAAIRAGKTLTDNADNLPAALTRIAEAEPQTSGAAPTLAEVSRDPGLAGFQRSFGSTNQKQGARISQQQQENATGRVAAVGEIAGPGDAAAVQAEAGAQAAALATSARTAGEATGPAAYPETSGSTARQLLDAAHDAAKARTRSAYQDPVLTEKTPVEVPPEFFDGLKAKLENFYGDAGGTMPPEMSSIISDIAGEAGNSNALTNLDRRLADFAGRQRMAGAGKEAAFAESVRSDLAGVADSALPPEQRAALATAKTARREQADAFEVGSVGKALAQERFGRPATPDSSIPQVLIPKGRAGGEAVAQLSASTSPANAEAIAREEIRRQMDVAPNAAAVARVRRDFEPVLRQFPALNENVTSAHGQMALAEAFPASPLGRFADATKSPTQVVASMLDAKDGGRAFTGLVNSLRSRPAALDGLRRSVHDYVVDASKTSAVNGAGDQVLSTAGGLKTLRNALDRDQGAKLFSPTQRQALLQIQGEMEGAQFANTANRTAGSDTARNNLLAGAGKLAGHSRTVRIVRVVMDLMNNQEQANALIGKAILDPKFAAELIRNVPAAQATNVGQRLASSVIGATAGAAHPIDAGTRPK